MRASSFATRVLACTLFAGTLVSMRVPVQAQDQDVQGTPQTDGVHTGKATATFPLIYCWYKGQVLFYIRTDTSDKTTAQQQGLNYVPQLGNVLSSAPPAYDDIYTFTNYNQYNVVPSAPYPIGARNSDRDYQPLWQVSQVAWNSGSKPRTLRSEEEILAAAKSGEVTLIKTNVIINCPIIFSPELGKLRNVRIQFGNNDRDRK